MHLGMGGPRMIWDSHSSNMEKPNANEREWAMGFHTNTTIVQGISEGKCRQIWGKLWISTTSHGFSVWSWQNNYIFANHTHPLTPSFTCCTFCWVNYGSAKGCWCYNRTSTSLVIMGSGMPRDIYGCGTWNWWCGALGHDGTFPHFT
jgi:hypothetical protein